MGHGFGAVKEQQLDQYGRRFAEAGLTALIIDYRNLGGSTGTPRGPAAPWEQQEDLRNAITWLRRHERVDRGRIGLWGTSFAGGHVLQVAAYDRRVRAVVSNVPVVDVWRNFTRLQPPEVVQGFLNAMLEDRERRWDGGPSGEIPISAGPGQLSVLGAATHEHHLFWQSLAPSWHNGITLESLEQHLPFSAADHIDLISPTPLLMVVATKDELTPTDLALAAFERAAEPKRVELVEGGHYDPYDDPTAFRQAADAAIEWFTAHL